MTGRLIVSVSGIRDETLDLVTDLARETDSRNVPLSLLIAPRLKNGYRLIDDEPTQKWLRTRKERGDALVLHGFDQAATKARRAEFAALPAHEAGLRLTAADRVLEQTGLRTRVFAAPRWNASDGALAALQPAGFRKYVGYSIITDLARDQTERARVLGIGDGFLTEPWWCRTLIAAANRVARRGGVVRLAVAAKHLSKPAPRQAILDSVDLALHHGATPATYAWEPREVSPTAAASGN